MIVRISYDELGVCCGEELSAKLAYDGQLCVRQRWDDEAQEAVYTNSLPEPEVPIVPDEVETVEPEQDVPEHEVSMDELADNLEDILGLHNNEG